jgi:hypothetical protein
MKLTGPVGSLNPAREAARLAERAAATPPRVTGTIAPAPNPSQPDPGTAGPAAARAARTTAAAPEPGPVAPGWRLDVDPDGSLVAVHDPTDTRVVIATPNPENGG